MAASFRSAGSIVNLPASGAATNVPAPAGVQDGDYLLLCIFAMAQSAAVAHTVPAGWSLIRSAGESQYNGGFHVYGKVAAGEPANYSVTNPNSSAGNGRGQVFAFNVGGAASPLHNSAVSSTVSGTSLAMPTLTTSAADILLVNLIYEVNQRTITFAEPGSMTERAFYSASSISFNLSDEVIPTAGAVGTRTYTPSTNCDARLIAIALNSAGGGGGGATAVTMTGPTSGVAGAASTNFTVGANGTITGSVVVTPSDGGAGGTFSPTSVTINTATPTGSFTYTASSAGAKTISATNNGGLTNPSNITYTATAAAATALTLSGPSTGTVGAPSTNFTVSANGTLSANRVVTPSDAGAGGTFAPTSLTLTSGSTSGTFTYTANSVGAKTISITNDGALTNPSALTYTASSVTSWTSPPLVRNNGTLVANVTLTWASIKVASTGAPVAVKTNVAVNGSGIFTLPDAAMTAGVAYQVDWKESTGEYGVYVGVAA